MSGDRGIDPGLGRHDERDDAHFYATRRDTAYLDGAEASWLESVLGEILPPGPYLDLMSGRRTYLPATSESEAVLGLGLSERELRTNKRLDQLVVHDLNRDPRLPLPSGRFRAVVCSAAVQYLVQPVAVFREVHRVLGSGGVFVVSFSGNYFPRKAIARWRVLNDDQREALVRTYFRDSAPWGPVRGRVHAPAPRPDGGRGPLRILWATA